MNRTVLEDAIHAWMVTTTGYAPAKVIWSEQDTTRPADDYALLTMGTVVTLGPFDMVTEETDLGRPAGQEIKELVEGLREITCRVQVFSRALLGATCASAVLTRAQTRLNLPSVLESFDVAGGWPSDRGSVQSIPGLLGTSRFESRAFIDVTFSAVDTAEEFTGYVDNVGIVGTISGMVSGDGTVDINTPPG